MSETVPRQHCANCGAQIGGQSFASTAFEGLLFCHSRCLQDFAVAARLPCVDPSPLVLFDPLAERVARLENLLLAERMTQPQVDLQRERLRLAGEFMAAEIAHGGLESILFDRESASCLNAADALIAAWKKGLP